MKTDSTANCNCDDAVSAYDIEALVSVDERGQMVLPKDLREKVNIKAGDKFVLITSNNEKGLCCITLVKAEEFRGVVKDYLDPVFKKILG